MRQEIGTVDLVEVDRVDVKAAQRVVAGLGQPARRGVVGNTRPDAALGREHHAIAQARRRRQDPPQVRLDPAELEAVDVRGVDQVHAQVERRVQQPPPVVEIVLDEAPGAEGQRADGEEVTDLARRGIHHVAVGGGVGEVLGLLAHGVLTLRPS